MDTGEQNFKVICITVVLWEAWVSCFITETPHFTTPHLFWGTPPLKMANTLSFVINLPPLASVSLKAN